MINNYSIPGNAVPTVKITLGTPFPGVPAGNDPWSRGVFRGPLCLPPHLEVKKLW